MVIIFNPLAPTVAIMGITAFSARPG